MEEMMEIDVRYAGFWRRSLAFLIDGLITFIPFFAAILIFGFGKLLEFEAEQMPVFQVVGIALAILFYVGFLASPWQATPGKRLMDVYVGRVHTGGRLTIGRALGRYLVFNLFILLMVTVTYMAMPSKFSMMPPQDSAEMTRLTTKQLFQHQKLTPEEAQSLHKLTVENNVLMTTHAAHLTDEEVSRYQATQEKRMIGHQPLTEEEKQFEEDVHKREMHGMFLLQIPNLLNCLYLIINALMIGCSKQKAGIHDRVCGTRVFRGRPVV